MTFAALLSYKTILPFAIFGLFAAAAWWLLEMFAGKKDYEAARRGRTASHTEINRLTLRMAEIDAGLRRPLCDQLELIRLRNRSLAFGGRLTIVDTPADNVGKFASFTFAYACYSILGFELAIEFSGATRNDLDDCYHVVFDIQSSTDAVVRQTHLNSVFLTLTRRQIA